MRHRTVTGARLAIRQELPSGEVLLLAVPPIPAGTPRETRVRIFEYVLCRQLGLASMLTEVEHDPIRPAEVTEALLSIAPHSTARTHGQAA